MSANREAFGKYVRLAEEPQAVLFETFYRVRPGAAPGPSDWWLMAILSYDAPSLQRLTQSARVSKETVSFDAGEVRPWFPPAVRNALIRSAKGRDWQVLLTGPMLL